MAQSAEKPTDSADRESLRGVTGVEVVVEPLDIEIEQFGLHTETLQRDIKQRLHKTGVRVLTERERLAAPNGVLLTIRMDAVHDRISRYFYSIDLFVSRKVRLESQPDSELSAVTWRKTGTIKTIADDNVKHIETQILQKVDLFIKDYLAVNFPLRPKS
jgi:hypothetical protein